MKITSSIETVTISKMRFLEDPQIFSKVRSALVVALYQAILL